jgi:hypothetical protein
MYWRKSSYTNGGENCVEVGNASWRKSHHSNGGENACVEVGRSPWRKATYSSNGGATCVETATDFGLVLVRDTKDREGGTLDISTQAWATFTTSLR